LYVIRNVDLWPNALATSTAEAGWTDLFNGRDLTGWSIHKSEGQQPPIPWTADAERQVLVANSGGQNWLETDKSYRDFVLTLDWRFPPGKFVGPNGSGIAVRAEGLNAINYDPKGVEIEVLRSTVTVADKSRGPGDFVTYDTRIVHSTGATPDRGNGMKRTTTEPQVSAVTNWNTCEITCQGDRISVTMNGVLVNEASAVPQRAGKICLRSQNADVEFRNIRIQNLDVRAGIAPPDLGTPGDSTSRDEAARRDIEALQGTWQAVAEETDGTVLSPDEVKQRNRTVVVDGNSFTMTRMIDGMLETYGGTLEIDARSRNFDWRGTDPSGTSMGLTGIYSFEGDTLRLCYRRSENRAERPTEFRRGQKRVVILTLKRETRIGQ
jgi:uncharacterized protein (TIGR03067 family)